MVLQLFAFYGTLKNDSVPREINVSDSLRHICSCRIPGRLYDLGRYPGLKLHSTSSDEGFIDDDEETVAGELYRVEETSAIQKLDRYEGYDPENPETSLFMREKVRVAAKLDSEFGGEETEAWTYIYNREADESSRIESDVWR